MQVQAPPRPGVWRGPQEDERDSADALRHVPLNTHALFISEPQTCLMMCRLSSGEKVLFTKGAESAILPYAKSGEIEKTRVHVDEFAMVSALVHALMFAF